MADAAALKAETALTGIASRPVLRLAMAAGVRHFSGPLIGEADTLPQPLRPLDPLQNASGGGAGRAIPA